MFYWLMYATFGALVGSFGTAFVHQKTGRDVQMGGLIGAVVGAIGGLFFVMLLWLWLYYDGGTFRSVGKVYNVRRNWYNWWS